MINVFKLFGIIINMTKKSLQAKISPAVPFAEEPKRLSKS